jgi:hypothetical protein
VMDRAVEVLVHAFAHRLGEEMCSGFILTS